MFAAPDPAIVAVLVRAYSFMAVCSLVTLVHPKLRRPEGKKLRDAINSWWPSALLGGAMVTLGPLFAVPVVAVLCVFGLFEYVRLLPPELRRRAADILGVALAPLCLAAVAFVPLGAALGLALVATFAILPVLVAFAHGPDRFLDVVGRYQFGLVLTILGIGQLGVLFLVGGALAAGLATVLMLSVMANDAAQFIFGKLFGRHRLVPQLSPNKTWEGLLGGVLVTSAIGATIGPSVAGWSAAVGASCGAAISLLGLVGDLLVSTIKRDIGVKDTGRVLPGQGGLLDRLDSLTLTAPAFVAIALVWPPA